MFQVCPRSKLESSRTTYARLAEEGVPITPNSRATGKAGNGNGNGNRKLKITIPLACVMDGRSVDSDSSSIFHHEVSRTQWDIIFIPSHIEL